MKITSPFSLLITFILLVTTVSHAAEVVRSQRRAGALSHDLYVAPHGSDANVGTRESPLATPQAARDRIRAWRQAGGAGAARILFREGCYALTQPLELDTRDSGSAEAPMTYCAVPGETVVWSGGMRVQTPWHRLASGVWVTELPTQKQAFTFRQLFVKDRRERRARYPNVDAPVPSLFGYGDQKDSVILKEGGVKDAWVRADDAQIHVHPEWFFFNQIQTIVGSDAQRKSLRLSGEQHARIIQGSYFHVEGVFEELDQPREWHYDRRTRRLSYQPESGQEPHALEIVVPRLTTLVRMQCAVESGSRVHNIRFENIAFRHVDYTLGHIEARVATDAAVILENAQQCAITGCSFDAIGGYAIWLHLDACENLIASNTIAHAGAGGVLMTSARLSYMDDSKVFTPGIAAAALAPLRNTITRNHIHHCGEIRHYCSGIHLDSRPESTALMAGNTITHNHIHDMSRNGIFAFRNQGGNVIAFNRLENLMLETEDGGGVHFATMNQMTAPNVIMNNLIANVWGYRLGTDGKRHRHIARGIYLDWYTAGTRVESNVVYNTLSGGLQFNAGDNNQFRNNVVVGDGVRWDKAWGGANACGTVDERNLVVASLTGRHPLENPAAGRFGLKKEFSGYPPGFAWLDVSQMGLAGQAESGATVESLAREGGVLPFDAREGVLFDGPWERHQTAGTWNLYTITYRMAKPGTPARAVFTLPVRSAGLYEVRLRFPTAGVYAKRALVRVEHADGASETPVDFSRFGHWPRLGCFRFEPGKPARVVLSARGADGRIAIEGVGFVRLDD